ANQLDGVIEVGDHVLQYLGQVGRQVVHRRSSAADRPGDRSTVQSPGQAGGEDANQVGERSGDVGERLGHVGQQDLEVGRVGGDDVVHAVHRRGRCVTDELD